ncbi:MAG: type IX secretion system membrane protein PorP/SprF [Ignavibacteriales bacterium]|nr:MAG: type IX secretion system membrane protein PorP/SprF [Ignavibacteriales bacterium]
MLRNRNLISGFFLLLLILLLLVLPVPQQAQTVIGKYAGEFMAIGVGGRSSGMGGAFVAVANDVTAGYWNPAALASVNYPQISLMHEEHFGNLVNYNYGSVAIPYEKDMSFGFSVIRLGVDGIPDTRNAGWDVNGDGVIDLSSGDRIKTDLITEFNTSDWAFFFTFAKKYSDDFYYGANVKFIIRDIAEYSAYGVGFDVGAWYTPMEKLYLGANLQDITTTLVAWSTGRNELITPTAKIGAAYQFDFSFGRIMPAVDFDVRFENRKFASQFNIGPVSFDPHFGLEYGFKNLFAVRAGYNDVKQFTIGAGVKLPKLNIDYSFARFAMSKEDRLDDSHRISLILTLEEPRFLRSSE